MSNNRSTNLLRGVDNFPRGTKVVVIGSLTNQPCDRDIAMLAKGLTEKLETFEGFVQSSESMSEQCRDLIQRYIDNGPL